MVQLKTKLDAVGGKQVKRPKEEWVRVENTHEPIITSSADSGHSRPIPIAGTLRSTSMVRIWRCLRQPKGGAELFLDRNKVSGSRQVIKRNSPLSVSDRISATIRSIEAAQKS